MSRTHPPMVVRITIALSGLLSAGVSAVVKGLTASEAAAAAPVLREQVAELHRLVVAVEAIAEGRSSRGCRFCSSQFYPSRSDAVYCSDRCRQSAHRRLSSVVRTVLRGDIDSVTVVTETQSASGPGRE